MIKIKIPIVPKSVQGGARFASIGGRMRKYSDKNKQEFQKEVVRFVRAYMEDEGISAPITDLVAVRMMFYFPRPKYMMTKRFPPGRIPHGKKPDLGNVAKGILDCLISGVIFRNNEPFYGAGLIKDDALVWNDGHSKYYCPIGSNPGIIIKLQITKVRGR